MISDSLSGGPLFQKTSGVMCTCATNVRSQPIAANRSVRSSYFRICYLGEDPRYTWDSPLMIFSRHVTLSYTTHTISSLKISTATASGVGGLSVQSRSDGP